MRRTGPVRQSGRERPRYALAVVARALAATLLASLGLVTVGAELAHAEEVYARPASGSWSVLGHGFGHGHGMSQWGAYGAAYLGKSHDEILAAYYPGTTQTSVADDAIRVRLTADPGSLRVSPAAGLTAVEGGGARTLLPTGPDQWRLVPVGGGLQLQSSSGGTWSPVALSGQPTLTAQVRFETTSGTVRVWRPDGSSTGYQGKVTGSYASASAVTTVLALPLETYLRSVVPQESAPSWPTEALRAQAVAARSFAVQAMRRRGAGYDICDTTACQTFSGTTAYSASGTATSIEYASTTAAVSATAGVILTYQGAVATTQYAASNGGWSTSGGTPYLVAKADPWDGAAPGDPLHSWQASLPASAVEAAFPAIGTLQRLVITSRDGHGEWGGRVLGVRLEGSAGTVTTTGAGVVNARPYPASSSGLRSSWWSFADATPVPVTPPVVFASGAPPFWSPAHTYQMSMQPDGNLVVYSASGQLAWTTRTSVPGSYLAVQSDGNLVLYDPWSSPVWTAAVSSPGAGLTMQDDGNLVLYSAAGAALWDSGGYAQHPAVYSLAKRVITTLASGSSATSPTGTYRVTMQPAGALTVTASSTGAALWSSGSAVAGSFVAAQSDGNVVVYSPANRPVWTAAVSSPGARLVFQDDGNLVVYDTGGRAVWDSLGYAGRPGVLLG